MADQVSKRAFRDFPPEVRDIIYGYSFQPSPASRESMRCETPVLLAALRGEPQLYSEALHYYYKTTSAVITVHNFTRFKVLSSASRASIRHLSIFMDGIVEFYRGAGNNRNNVHVNQFQTFLSDDAIIPLATNAETIHVKIDDIFIRMAEIYIPQWVKKRRTVRRLEVHMLFEGSDPNSHWLKGIDSINNIFLGVKGKLLTVPAIGWLAETWFWEEQNGGLLRAL